MNKENKKDTELKDVGTSETVDKAVYDALVAENEEIISSQKENEKALKEAKDALEESNDKYLRMAAEYENYRKRTAKEREGLYSDAYVDALKEILPIIDNLERAVAAEGGDKISDGLKLIMSQVSDTLSKMGAESYGAPGDSFDPEIHNAVMHIEDDSIGEGEITEVFQKGYKKGDKIVRYAMVKVAN
ncbi:MAG: nucleotide exchange factor GrpE [Ruminococcaceae bacterium]|nr:nucleotide exchange factor GrpE [Oscillospiraceae bacterium]